MSIRHLASVVAAGCLFSSALLRADCTYPKPPDPPDAKSATKEQMIEAMKGFKAYNADVDAYVTCLDAETEEKVKAADGVGAIMQIKAIQAKKKTASQDERAAKVEVFNKAVREFKAANGG